jgi:hypothetical protein
MFDHASRRAGVFTTSQGPSLADRRARGLASRRPQPQQDGCHRNRESLDVLTSGNREFATAIVNAGYPIDDREERRSEDHRPTSPHQRGAKRHQARQHHQDPPQVACGHVSCGRRHGR